MRKKILTLMTTTKSTPPSKYMMIEHGIKNNITMSNTKPINCNKVLFVILWLYPPQKKSAEGLFRLHPRNHGYRKRYPPNKRNTPHANSGIENDTHPTRETHPMQTRVSKTIPGKRKWHSMTFGLRP